MQSEICRFNTDLKENREYMDRHADEKVRKMLSQFETVFDEQLKKTQQKYSKESWFTTNKFMRDWETCLNELNRELAAALSGSVVISDSSREFLGTLNDGAAFMSLVESKPIDGAKN